mmetsp:Transcript_47403/g.148291  ORF Transcript_47403/g.148291 Transcript_47403/m.148291 type:complete len:339 (-) Transcript_47403:1311-2327(-)
MLAHGLHAELIVGQRREMLQEEASSCLRRSQGGVSAMLVRDVDGDGASFPWGGAGAGGVNGLEEGGLEEEDERLKPLLPRMRLLPSYHAARCADRRRLHVQVGGSLGDELEGLLRRGKSLLDALMRLVVEGDDVHEAEEPVDLNLLQPLVVARILQVVIVLCRCSNFVAHGGEIHGPHDELGEGVDSGAGGEVSPVKMHVRSRVLHRVLHVALDVLGGQEVKHLLDLLVRATRRLVALPRVSSQLEHGLDRQVPVPLRLLHVLEALYVELQEVFVSPLLRIGHQPLELIRKQASQSLRLRPSQPEGQVLESLPEPLLLLLVLQLRQGCAMLAEDADAS